MLRSDQPRAVLLRSLALLTVLALTTGWSTPARGPVSSSGPAEAAQRDASATVRATAWELGWEARAVSSNVASSARNAARAETSTPPRRPAAAAEAEVEVPAEVRAALEARAAAAAVTSAPAKKAPAQAATKSQAPTYRGTNHFWIPSLGMSYGVHPYACSATFYPRNLIYRWGCAGKNNVYILGHAHSVMKPLHDLYVSGRLRVGMVAVYANASGVVRTYRVTEWRVVRPTEIAWQIAAQPVPSMTLQTCVGRDSEYRLNVRLVATN